VTGSIVIFAARRKSSRRRLAIGSRVPSITIAVSKNVAAETTLQGVFDGHRVKRGVGFGANDRNPR